MWCGASFVFKASVCPRFSFSGCFARRFLEASCRRCHSSSGFSLSQFLHIVPDRLMMIRSDLCVEQTQISLDYYN